MNFLRLDTLDIDAINHIFYMADQLKASQKQVLAGKTFVLFFPESSIRTRLSFEKGIKDLGGQCVLFPPTTLDKREALKDVAGYIENWADAIVVRHKDFDRVAELATSSKVPVINAMTADNHPCEILGDMYALSKLRENYRDLVYTFVGGDGNIINSWRSAAKVFGFKLNHVCQGHYRLEEDHEHYHFNTSLAAVLGETDVMLTDPLPKGLRTQYYYKNYQVTLARMEACKPGALLNPCPPFYRGEEVSAEVIDADCFVGYGFKQSLMAVQQAIILYCLGMEP